MDAPAGDTLALRALHATRRLHLPSYVAIRYMVETVVGRTDSAWMASTLPRKFPHRKEARFHSVLKFKKMSPQGLPEYREFMVPSPTAALTEAIVLAYLSKSQSFQKMACVYSYLWPQNTSTSPFNFEHYVNGYKARNDAIAKFVDSHPGYSLLVSDIEKFYPNIRRGTVRARFASALNESEIPDEIRATAVRLLEQLFTLVSGDKGIATGPSLSHVIGDLALCEIDKSLSQRFPNAYFRYVDDIVIAVPEGKEAETFAILRDLVAAEGLVIQKEKSEVVPGSDWAAHGPHHLAGVKEDSFEALIFLIKAYMASHPTGKDRLAAAFEERGYSIPLQRFAASARTEKFTRRLKRFLRMGWRVAMRVLVATERDVLVKADGVKAATLAKLRELLELPTPESATRRKWHVQKLRYHINRALYLCADSELKFLIPSLAAYPEFVETVALLKVLAGGDLGELLRLPGAAVTACGGILASRGTRLQELDQLQDARPEVVESLSSLMLFGVCEIGSGLLESFDADSRDFLLFCDGMAQGRRERTDFSYLDEIRSLQMSRGREERFMMLNNRFSDSEGVVLDALDIGDDYDY